MKIRKVYHHYEKWEDYLNGMWRKVTPEEEKEYLQKAIEFTGDHKLYGSWMLKVIKAWPLACEHNLTDTGMNRRAWVGHSAVCLAFGCPEYITRLAWWHLTKEQQDLANAQADRAIEKWERDYVLNRNNYKQNQLFSNLN